MKKLFLILAIVANTAYADCTTRTSAVIDGDEVTSARNVTVCVDGQKPSLSKRVKIGEEVFENELATVDNVGPKYFNHKQSKCRLFRERYMWNGAFRLNHGVICQINEGDALWTVVDKWQVDIGYILYYNIHMLNNIEGK